MARIKTDQSLILLSEERRKGPSIVELFLNRTPQYTQSPANSKEMLRYMKRNKLDVTLGNLERAFNVLKIEGRLELQAVKQSVIAPEILQAGQEINDGAVKALKQIIAANAADKEPEYVVRPLTRDEISLMRSEERVWHAEHNYANWLAALKDTGVGTK